MKTISIDIETFSSVDLAKSGVYRYAESPDFEVLLFGYSVDGGAVSVVDLASGEKIPSHILSALEDETVIKCAFNANFERICLSRLLGYETGRYLSPVSWHCTMVWSAYMGLPLSLQGCGAVLRLDRQKLTEGKELIRYFCVPCQPTKANGGRTRNRPGDAPEKWARFKIYNARDVETEAEIQQKLSRFPVPEEIWDEYCIDQKINDTGVALDRTLVRKAIAMDGVSGHELSDAMKSLTALENPNSVSQMKAWLAANGLHTDTLGKKTVTELLKTAPERLREVLLLRQQLAKSSVKKYQAMENAVCSDGRARGMFQFYGANRTGRWAGRLIQMQNLPQNHLSDLSQARALVRTGNREAVKLLYEDIPDTLSQLIRTAFVAPEGKKFIVADFSAIEARVIAWMAGETWRQQVFADACSLGVSEDDLEGRVCYGGLDLSSTTDITAFVLVFPPEDETDRYIILPYFWLPEDNLPLRVNRDHVPYDVWERQGFLQTTEGNVVHYGYIEKFIERLGERFNIREIAFDRWGAVQMVQNLEGMGFTVVPFGQGFKDMSPPTKELMKLVLEQRIAHGGHPVLRWMMDNIYIRTDPAGNIKPDKEKSTEKIDGAVAAIMALDRAIRCGNVSAESVYDARGLLFL